MDYKKEFRKLVRKAKIIEIHNSMKEKLNKHKKLIYVVGIEYMIAAIIGGILIIMEVMLDLCVI